MKTQLCISASVCAPAKTNVGHNLRPMSIASYDQHERMDFDYSYLMASIGSRLEAFLAGI